MTNRRMLSGTNALNYQLYQDSSRTTVWGSDLFADPPTPPALTLQLNLVGSGSLNATIFARVFGGQSAAPVGLYQSSFSGVEARLRYEGCLLGICPACSSSLGALADTSFTVSATVASDCRVSATTLDFGTAGVLSANVDATNTIDIQCTPGTPWRASLDSGHGLRREL